MSTLAVIVLTTAVGFEVNRSPSSEARDAFKTAVKAAYIQTGTDEYVKTFERKYTPKVVKEYGGWVAGIVKVVTEKRVSVAWKF
jgi:hypothetical protein